MIAERDSRSRRTAPAERAGPRGSVALPTGPAPISAPVDRDRAWLARRGPPRCETATGQSSRARSGVQGRPSARAGRIHKSGCEEIGGAREPAQGRMSGAPCSPRARGKPPAADPRCHDGRGGGAPSAAGTQAARPVQICGSRLCSNARARPDSSLLRRVAQNQEGGCPLRDNRPTSRYSQPLNRARRP